MIHSTTSQYRIGTLIIAWAIVKITVPVHFALILQYLKLCWLSVLIRFMFRSYRVYKSQPKPGAIS